MPKKSKSIAKIYSGIYSLLGIFIFLIIWEILVKYFGIEKWILPSPSLILFSLVTSFWLILHHLQISILESILGLFLGSLIGIIFAFLMDWSHLIKKIIYPLLLISQTIPFITLAPLLVIWFGYGITAKILIIALVSFFPITVNVTQGLTDADNKYLKLVKSFGAGKWQTFASVKIPSSTPHFFSGLRIAAAYSLLTAVVSEWIGSDRGLGILLLRSAKSYATERVFAVVIVISFLSLFLVKIVDYFSLLLSYKKGE